MPWENSTTLGRQEKRRKKHGGLMEFLKKKHLFGLRSMGFASTIQSPSPKEQDLRGLIREQMKSIAILPSFVKYFAA